MSPIKKKVLLAEDDPSIIDVVKIVLESEGHQVFVASTESEVHSLLQKVSPHIVFLDIFLSGSTGKNIAQSLRKKKSTASIPIFFLSASTDLPTLAKDAGVSGYIQKPFDISELLDIVHRAE